MKNSIKKILKRILLVIGFIIVLLLLFLLYSFISHKLKSNKELKYLEKYDMGKIVEIEGKKINYKIFNEDNTEHIILLMGGSGVTDLSLSFEPLARNINAKIILINRPGYGLSEDTKTQASVEYIVNFYRDVLKELNVTEKVILMPHSLSGMYAIYWAIEYPNEIDSIIGLDIGSPYSYLKEENNNFINNISYLGSKLGIHRFIYKKGSANSAIKNYDVYDDNIFEAIWYMNMINPYSKFNLSEENLIKENANKVVNNIGDNYYKIKKLYIMANSISGNFYEKYEKNSLKSYYKNDMDINKYIQYVKETQENEVASLSLDNNTIFSYVEGPHLLYYYPSNELINVINNFLTNR
ncbi:MAG: alpha/beta hydrolase [Ruminococcus sp.]|nr:alpha/beta hydrolase [Ruminococcus sp.]